MSVLPRRRPPSGSLHGAGSLAGALLAHSPQRAALAVGLLLISAVTETFGLVLLIPFLAVAGLEGPAGSGSPVREAVAAAAAAAGVPLTLPVMLGALVLLAAVRSGVAWQRQVQLATLRLGFVDRLRERLYTATANAGWEFLSRRRQSDLLHLLTHDVGRAGNGGMSLIRGVVDATFTLARVALAVAISAPVTVGIVVVGAVLLGAARPLVRRSRALGRQLTEGGREMHVAMSGFLGGLKQAKSEGAEMRHVRAFAGALARMRRDQLDFTRLSAAAQAAFGMGAAGALAAIAWVAVRQLGLGLGAPELLVLALIAMRVLPGLRRLQREAQQLAHVLPAWLHAIEMERALLEAVETPAGAGGEPVPLKRELTVAGVRFAYRDPPAERPALADVDIVIPAGRFVAVTGPSGAGKSTLGDLLLGLLESDAGQIRVDGVLLAGAVRRRWRQSVACAPQEPYLFHESIRTNLLRARPDAPEAELWRALRQAAAAEFVAALPEGLDTVVGDRGARLSGGERQRIVLARALLREPALLLLDEATNQLDADAERGVLETLRSLRGRTTIVALSHRPAVMAAADQVIVLEAGRVASAGPWKSLAPRLVASRGERACPA